MKKIISIFIVISLLMIGFQLFLVVGESDKEIEMSKETRGGQRGSTLYVGPGQKYSTIGAAIMAAKPGDTIRVFAGTYNENVIINRRINLIGNGTLNTIIDGKRIGDVVKIIANQVNITGFKIMNSSDISSGIYLQSSNNCKIENCNFPSNRNGIFLNDSSNNIITANSIESNSNSGIYICNSSSNIITNNDIISNNVKGVHLKLLSTNNLIKGNNISSHNDFGIFLDTSPNSGGIIGFNDDHDFYIDVGYGYNASQDKWYYTFPGNGKFDPGTLDTINGTRVRGDVIVDDSTGLLSGIWDSGDTVIRDPLKEEGEQTIHFNYTPPGTPGRVNFTGALIDEESPDVPGSGKWADDDGDWNKTIDDVGSDGLPGTNDDDGTEGNGWPDVGEPHVDEDLNVTEFRKPSTNVIKDNRISYNKYGIYIENSLCNSIYHNDLISNTNQACDYGKNIWNTSTKGNHWSDWTFPDQNNDGIVDNPYNISGSIGVRDYFPLVKPFKNYIINLPSTKILMNASFSNSTNETVYLLIHKTTLNAKIKGQLNGSINCNNLELIIINSSHFAGKGFFIANWTATIEGISYSGTWQGMLYKKTGNKIIFLKGTLFGGLHGITEGYLTESKKESGIYDVYKSNWTISYLGYEVIYAKLVIDGTITYQNSNNLSSKIYILQVSYKGNATGCYNKSLDIVITHVRINDLTSNYNDQGFSIITYISTYGNGLGWTYDKIISKNTVNITGFFTNPILGIVVGKLYDNGPKRALSLSIIKIDTGLPPRAIISIILWGRNRVSPGDTINYFLEYANYGVKDAMNIKIIMSLPNDVQYISSTGNGSHNNLTNDITWLVNINAKTKCIISAKCKVKWGLSQGTKLVYNGSVVDFKKQKLLAFCLFTSIVVVAKDPNLKYGPDGNVIPGQRLNYKIEFENEGAGTAYGVYFTDELSDYLNDSSLQIDPVYSTIDKSIIAPTGRYEPNTRTITWFVGEVGSHMGGYTNVSIKVKNNLPQDTVILNYATILFPSVPEVTRTNGIVSMVKWNQGPTARTSGNLVVKTFEEIIFDGSGSFDPEMHPLTFKWDFGDGNGTDWFSENTTTHKYTHPGNYTVTLTVSDGEFTDSDTCKVWVINEIINSSPEIKDIPLLHVHYYTPSKADEYPGYGYDFSYFISDPDNNRSELTIKAIAVEQNLMNYIEKDPNNNMRLIFKLPFEIADGKTHPIYLYVSDPFHHEARKLFNIIVVIDNWPVELVYSIDDQSFDEDGSKDNAFKLDYYFNDKDGGTSYEIITQVNSKLNVVIDSNNYIDLSTIEENWSGFEEVVVLAKDTQPEQYVYCIIEVQVKPVNDPPVILEIPKLNSTVHKEGVLNLSQYIVDVDNEISDLIIETSDTDHVKINGTRLIYKFDTKGEYTVILTISDGEYTDSIDLLFNITVPKEDPFLDSDDDGIPDNEDAFPLDPAASIDTDGDNYPDSWNPGMSEEDSTTGLKLDEFPDDPSRFKKEASQDETSQDNTFVIILVVIVIVILLIIFSSKLFLAKSKIQRKDKHSLDNEMLDKVKDQILQGEPLKELEYSRNEIESMLERTFKANQISENTYNLIRSEVLYSNEDEFVHLNDSIPKGKE